MLNVYKTTNKIISIFKDYFNCIVRYLAVVSQIRCQTINARWHIIAKYQKIAHQEIASVSATNITLLFTYFNLHVRIKHTKITNTALNFTLRNQSVVTHELAAIKYYHIITLFIKQPMKVKFNIEDSLCDQIYTSDFDFKLSYHIKKKLGIKLQKSTVH